MFFYLIMLFTIVPMLELYVLLRVGAYIGFFNTVMLVVVTGIFGAYLARMEGLRVLYSVQKELNAGKMPTSQLLDGLLILVGGVLLITPGILTDIAGFVLVIPATRILIKQWLRIRFQAMIDEREDVITVSGFSEEDE